MIKTQGGERRVLGENEGFVAGREVKIATAGTASALSAYVGYGLWRSGNKWATLFAVFSAVSAMKFLHDLSVGQES